MTSLSCNCGTVRLEVSGPPILAADCCCTSCRRSAEELTANHGAPEMLDRYGATSYVLVRKDRISFVAGQERMREHRLSPDAKTRRVVAGCCGTPLFLEFAAGHWMSVYSALWPEEARPAPELRTMVSDLPDASVLPDDIPNAKRQSAGFMWRLLSAWAAMGFRNPKMPEVQPIGR
ncbi:GFA family protein [Pelagovum pacificum]|uniref:CENP-V/GFA domain-containing protein n=1 Tax=Pelagovum pacificum TaxID=2588711 RepID=A0A5C5GIH5_9RHOB|nr:hypothetical protein [Pelagovum pacificum]QQA43149.1 hypothetical protein I8N54_00810 [Pelagovum pacificum]TNY33709.1 hypothetical protein FHY64_10705 [Pelagovum pacificum]